MKPSITTIDEVTVGMTISDKHSFNEIDLEKFSGLAKDTAPIHWDGDFAITKRFKGRLVYGYLVAAPFSGLLGMHLPGQHTVIQSTSFQLNNPVYMGDEIEYKVTVSKVVLSVKTVVLDLLATNQEGKVVLRGTAQCGFR